MTPKTRALLLACFAAFAPLFGGSTADADVYDSRQYYSNWYTQTTTTTTYYYRNYYFKPSVDYSGYQYHQVCYYPQYPDYYYYYNPHSHRFWGRTPVRRGGKAVYSMLSQEDRKEKLTDIPESAFPEPSAPPPIPESKDNIPMAMPPQDLPRMTR